MSTGRTPGSCGKAGNSLSRDHGNPNRGDRSDPGRGVRDVCFLRRRTPYGPHQSSRKRQHHPRPRPSQSTPQPRQTLRATSPAPTLCQSWEAILGRRPKTRGHALRNGCHSHAKLCKHRLLRRLCASLGRLSILGGRPRTPRSTRVNALSDADRGVMGTSTAE